MANPETRVVRQQKQREYYEKNKEEIKRKQCERYQMYKHLYEDYYKKRVANPETRAVMQQKQREYYEKNKEEIKRKQHERYHRKKTQT